MSLVTEDEKFATALSTYSFVASGGSAALLYLSKGCGTVENLEGASAMGNLTLAMSSFRLVKFKLNPFLFPEVIVMVLSP